VADEISDAANAATILIVAFLLVVFVACGCGVWN
jgi:hypothetical protein